MEEQHPIPQQISSYQFRLVGDMTLKQFFQVAGGAIVALILYSSGLPFYVKWPLIIVSFLFGVALAFFPLADRPLETWIFAFLKTIYSPTFYFWKRLEKKPPFFQPEQATPEAATIVNLQEPTIAFGQLEKTEQEFLSKVTEHFNAPATAPIPSPPAQVFTRAVKPSRKGVTVLKTGPIRVEAKPEKVKAPSPPPVPQPARTARIAPSVGQKVEEGEQASFSSEAAPPIPPTKPNIIVGQVVDPDGKIVENAILEIKDEDGRSVRALKSNKLGHFMIVTPLANGKYQIITEAEGFNFAPVNLIVKGEIIPPVAIWAKGLEAKKVT